MTLSKTLCYVFLEFMVRVESRGSECDTHIVSIVSKDIFLKTLVATCVEIVLAAHNSQKTFPWITEVTMKAICIHLNGHSVGYSSTAFRFWN